MTRPGLRDRKKAQTRDKLVDVAMELVHRQGFAQTTIWQIAAVADVSPRTVARYFPSKDDLVLAFIDDFADAIDEQLARVPADESPLQALLSATLSTLDGIEAGYSVISAERLAITLHLLSTTPPLREPAKRIRMRCTASGLAERLSASADDDAIKLMSAVWASITATAFGGLLADSADELPTVELLAVMRCRLRSAFSDLRELL
jgi:AcrR family transcriptional regulator